MQTKGLCGILVAVGLVLCLGVYAAADTAGAVQLTPIGHPSWKPVDFHVFTAPVGTPENPDFDFAQLMQTEMAVLPPPKHQWCDDLGIGPGTPHPPPYDHEIEEGLEDAEFKEGIVFHVAEFSPPTRCGRRL